MGITEGSGKVGVTTASSHLYLATADAGDSGEYTCNVGGRLATAKLSLHILNGT